MPLRISFQGEPGANSHSACQEVFPKWEAVPCPTFEDAFAALADDTVQLAMIPIENSIAGRVADIHNLLPTSGFHIIGEHFLPIHFQLMGLPGADLSTIKSVHSHIHALGQCRKIIRKLGFKAVIAGDTAGAAREIRDAQDITRASLSPRMAADLYGLKILLEDVEDEVYNTTRFVILSRTPDWVPVGKGPTVTSFVFRVRNIPAALYKALGGFATNGVNMTKLESYMVDGQFTATQFYAEVDGHPEEPALKRALEELDYFSKELRVLGVYAAHPFRERLDLGPAE
ncbi:prephenate dehydratase [Microvirga sp. W0021]|uniref:prephenate dehydratase n=1 Tax=Hohaiivirga grylli TaxID=3133970 RepID=A0ABV0BIM4_9HYPH